MILELLKRLIQMAGLGKTRRIRKGLLVGPDGRAGQEDSKHQKH